MELYDVVDGDEFDDLLRNQELKIEKSIKLKNDFVTNNK
jgi:hypothetical protein